MRRKKTKIKAGIKMLWIANISLLSWCAYNLTMIILKIRVANAVIAAFPHLGR